MLTIDRIAAPNQKPNQLTQPTNQPTNKPPSHVLLLVVLLEVVDFLTDAVVVASYRARGHDDLFAPGVVFLLLPALVFTFVYFHVLAARGGEEDDHVIASSVFKYLSPCLSVVCCPLLIVVLPCAVALKELRNARRRSRHCCCTVSFCLWRAESWEETAGNTNTDVRTRAVAACVFALFQNAPQLLLNGFFIVREGGARAPKVALASAVFSSAMIVKSLFMAYLGRRTAEAEAAAGGAAAKKASPTQVPTRRVCMTRVAA